jgi:hypothetical protein
VSGFALPDQAGSTGVLSQSRVAADLDPPEPARPPADEVGQVAERRRSSG